MSTAYKAFDKEFKCRGFQYAVGETYTHDGPVKMCSSGFHCCENPLDVLNYYAVTDSRFGVVIPAGEHIKHDADSKVACSKITVSAEIMLPEFIRHAVDYMQNICSTEMSASGYSSQLAASGDYSQLAASRSYSQLAASGDYSKLAASGSYSQLAASGDSSKLAASGYSSQLAASGSYSKLAASGSYSQLAASGSYSQLAASGSFSQLAASGKGSIIAAAGLRSKIRGVDGTAIAAPYKDIFGQYRFATGVIGEKGLRTDTWYHVDDAGNFVEDD